MIDTQQEVPSREEPLDVVLEGIVGSTAYGLAGPDSDVDRIGVFQELTITFLRLSGLPAMGSTGEVRDRAPSNRRISRSASALSISSK